jgi:hypothetical protein
MRGAGFCNDLKAYRVFPESQAPVENSTLAIAGAAFHTEQIFTGWGLLNGGPFRFSELAGNRQAQSKSSPATGSPSSVSLATTMPLPTTSPMEARPRILFWSRQNSKLGFGDPDLPGINASMSTISRQWPRPCVRPSQRCFPSFCQASRIAAMEYFEPLMIRSAAARI